MKKAQKLSSIQYYYKELFSHYGVTLNITVQMYPCSEGTDTDSPAL